MTPPHASHVAYLAYRAALHAERRREHDCTQLVLLGLRGPLLAVALAAVRDRT